MKASIRGHSSNLFWNWTARLSFILVFLICHTDLLGQPISLSDVLGHIQEQDARTVSLRLRQTEHFTNYRAPQANVTRTYEFEEQAGSYRVGVAYPALRSLPKLEGHGGNATYAYLPSKTTFNGIEMANYVLHGRTGSISSKRLPGQIDSYPVTNRRPFWPYRNSTLKDVILDQVRKPNADAKVTFSDDGSNLELIIASGKMRRVFTLDPQKGYNLIRYEGYYKGHLADRRTFGDYEIKDGVWLARTSRVEMYHSVTHKLAKVYLYTIDKEWAANIAIDPKRFRLSFPPGTLVRDLVRGVEYHIEDVDAVIGSNLEQSIESSLAQSVGQEGNKGESEDAGHLGTSQSPRGSRVKSSNERGMKTAELGKFERSSGFYDWAVLLWRPVMIFLAVVAVGVVIVITARRGAWRGFFQRNALRYALVSMWSICLAAAAGYVYLSADSDRLGPRMGLEYSIVNVGTIPSERVHLVEVPIRSVGTRDLEVTEIKKSCACEKVELDRRTIPSGEVEMLRIHYTPRRWREHEFGVSVVLVCNDPKNDAVSISIRGRSVPSIEIVPRAVSLGRVRRQSRQLAAFKVFDPPGHRLSVRGPEGNRIDKEVSIHEIKRFVDQAGREGLDVVLSARPSECGPWRRRVELSTNYEKCPRIPLKMAAEVNDLVNPKPPVLALDGPISDPNEAFMVTLDGLPFGPEHLSVIAVPNILKAELQPSDVDENSCVLRVTPLPGAFASAPVDGRILVSSSSGETAGRIVEIPFILRDRADTKRKNHRRQSR